MKLRLRQLVDQPLGKRPLLVADLRLDAAVDLGCILDLVREIQSLEKESILVHTDRDRGRLAAPGEGADPHPLRFLERLSEYSIATSAVLASAKVVRVLEVDGVDRTLRHEGVDDERRRGRLFKGLQLFRFEADVLILVDLVASYRLFARDDPVDGPLEAHRNPPAP